jgi:hypothetical protein
MTKMDLLLVGLTFDLTYNELTAIVFTSGSSIDERNARAESLTDIARDWAECGYSGGREILFKKVIDGESIFDMMMKPVIDKERISFAGTRLNVMIDNKKEKEG